MSTPNTCDTENYSHRFIVPGGVSYARLICVCGKTFCTFDYSGTDDKEIDMIIYIPAQDMIAALEPTWKVYANTRRLHE